MQYVRRHCKARFSKPLPQNFRLRFCILDRLLLKGQLNFQSLQFGLLLPKGYKQFFHGSSQGSELVGALNQNGLGSFGQLLLKTSNLIGRHLEPPSVVVYLPTPADSTSVVIHLDVL